jgi:hypothetical protein
LFQYVVDRNPVHAGGLHHYRLDATFLEPPRLLVQVLGKQPKLRTGCASWSGSTAARCSRLPMSIPAASRCTTSKPGLSDQMRRPRSFFCFRVSRGPLFDSVFVSFAIFFLHPFHFKG